MAKGAEFPLLLHGREGIGIEDEKSFDRSVFKEYTPKT